jgi:uncharacterized protein YgbK (DUF1537 family)
VRMGVVADDVTGANDIGIMFAKSGCLVHVYSYGGPGDFAGAPGSEDRPDVVILDTNSRLDPPEEARRKVAAATRELYDLGCRQFFNKTCSVFRGNIGAEFDAMLDALGREFAVVVLGFPKNGRTTVDGIHYVRGVPLAESEFRNDPVHPMIRSDLAGILQSQTARTVGCIGREVVAAGPAALRGRIGALQGTLNYVILDVVDQEALQTIAAAVHDEPVLCGSSALAEELPAHWGLTGVRAPGPQLVERGKRGVLVVAGSLMPQTARQTAALQEAGAVALVLDTSRLFDGAGEQEVERVTQVAAQKLKRGHDVLLQAPNLPGQVEATRAAGRARGFSDRAIAREVSAALAEAAGRAVEVAGVSRLAVAGGETSAAVCARLNVRGMRVWEEIQPGLPSCVSLTDPPLLLVLKSGSFGSPEFLIEAVSYLRDA